MVVTESELVDAVARDRAAGKTIAFANGCFDLLHVGHVRYLNGAAAEGDRLIVAVNDDRSVSALKGPGRPILGAADRAELVAALRRVDYVIVFGDATAARIDWLVSTKHREILDLVPVIDRRLAIDDRAGAGAVTRMLAGIREVRRARYDVALDLQGLLKSAVLARSAGARRVIGFSSRYVREPLARAFYTEAHDPKIGRASCRE